MQEHGTGMASYLAGWLDSLGADPSVSIALEVTDFLAFSPFVGLPVKNQGRQREGHKSEYHGCNVVGSRDETADQQVKLHPALSGRVWNQVLRATMWSVQDP